MCVPWHTSISCTLSLTETTVSTNSSCGCEIAGSGSGVHGDWLADDESISYELSDGLAGVGIGDLAGLIRIEPNLALSTSYNGCREALLCSEIDPEEFEMLAAGPLKTSMTRLPMRPESNRAS